MIHEIQLNGGGVKFTIPYDVCPWLEREERNIELSLVEFEGKYIFLGSAVGSKIKRYADKIKTELGDHVKINNEFNLILFQTLQNNRDFKRNHQFVNNPNSSREIEYIRDSDSKGQPIRLYFLKLPKLHGFDVVLKLGVCYKSDERELLKIFSRYSIR